MCVNHGRVIAGSRVKLECARHTRPDVCGVAREYDLGRFGLDERDLAFVALRRIGQQRCAARILNLPQREQGGSNPVRPTIGAPVTTPFAPFPRRKRLKSFFTVSSGGRVASNRARLSQTRRHLVRRDLNGQVCGSG